MLKILVVEDNNHIRNLICKNLQLSGYQTISAENGEIAYNIFINEHIDLIVSDIMMPKTDGITLLKEIRSINTEIPIIMLTALDSFMDKEKGFTSGADDYIVKPVDMKELVLRIKAHLRRYKIISENFFKHKEVYLDFNELKCLINNVSIELTTKEFMLLYKLSASNGRIFTREQLMNEIWGFDSESYERTVDTHIKKLRVKVKTNDLEIVTVRGLGYKVVLK
ncbi:MAG: response regulator transcription factor [Candidatus Izemoplasma sp.]